MSLCQQPPPVKTRRLPRPCCPSFSVYSACSVDPRVVAVRSTAHGPVRNALTAHRQRPLLPTANPVLRSNACISVRCRRGRDHSGRLFVCPLLWDHRPVAG